MLVRDNLVLDNREAVRLLGTRFYEQGKLSFRRSRIAGYTKRIIMELLGRYNASVFNYDEQKLKSNIRNAAR